MKTQSIITGMGFNTREYMNEEQITYFKNKLICRKLDILGKVSQQREKIKTLKINHSDILDRSLYSMNLDQETRIYERYTKLLRQIDEALERIHAGRFGYCEFTGKPIGLDRLEAMPFASLSIEALEEMESGYC